MVTALEKGMGRPAGSGEPGNLPETIERGPEESGRNHHITGIKTESPGLSQDSGIFYFRDLCHCPSDQGKAVGLRKQTVFSHRPATVIGTNAA